MRQKIKMWCHLERRNYLTSIANEAHCSTKRFWSFFSLKNKKKPIPDKMKLDGVNHCNDLARVDAFGHFLQSVYKDHNDCIIPDCYTCILPGSTDDSLPLIQVTIDEVSKLLKPLNIYKATGPDKLPNVILRKVC